ncbi:MAG: type 11 methyltransferase [Candidatus Nomurabacteria bacterium GW2011_GWA2_35_80]|uniref:Type 11 methyltransferase n=1 Tax=Candidatus Nomurabacteria bacterium GW2011_GWA2_35_80 TaxID=1618733 RepID=A0A0G0DHC8_9BACT|nr:MAG: type 11 methyltransferase [Candidatus Nomurabacteria bacterium GW2011_GWA2_35_80]
MFTDPVKNLKAFDLRENMIVADLGAGSGFYAIPAARMVPMGKVYAIEIQKDFLITIKNKAAER